MRSTKLAEIDTMKQNLGSVLQAIESVSDDAIQNADFHRKLDDFVEARNVSARQIAAIADLLETAFNAGQLCR